MDRTCAVCMCDVEEGELFAVCSSTEKPHYIHADECFPQFLSSVAQDRESADVYEKSQVVRCPSHCEGCSGAVTLEGAAAAGTSALKSFVSCTQTVACSVERRATVAHVEREAMKSSAEANAQLSQRMLEDVRGVLTTALSCPHCGAPFVDFSGCLALTCEGCSKEFCGVCCAVHARQADGHAAVVECTGRLTPAELKDYDFHSTYFISAKGWARWSERLRIAAVLRYFNGLRRDVVWDAFATVDAALQKEELLTDEARLELATKVYSHDVGAVHLVRIPITFWLLYSAKKNLTFEAAVAAVSLAQDAKIALGKRILSKVQKQYPSWVKVKTPIPGETFGALNYPPEFMPLIAKEIEAWGKGKYW